MLAQPFRPRGCRSAAAAAAAESPCPCHAPAPADSAWMQPLLHLRMEFRSKVIFFSALFYGLFEVRKNRAECGVENFFTDLVRSDYNGLKDKIGNRHLDRIETRVMKMHNKDYDKNHDNYHDIAMTTMMT